MRKAAGCLFEVCLVHDTRCEVQATARYKTSLGTAGIDAIVSSFNIASPLVSHETPETPQSPQGGSPEPLGFESFTAAAPVRSRWTRHTIVDGLEMHIETGLPRDEARLVDDALRELRDKLIARRRAGGENTR